LSTTNRRRLSPDHLKTPSPSETENKPSGRSEKKKPPAKPNEKPKNLRKWMG
jgi:hypothetical protein